VSRDMSILDMTWMKFPTNQFIKIFRPFATSYNENSLKFSLGIEIIKLFSSIIKHSGGK
jgi:hypothetical protein